MVHSHFLTFRFLFDGVVVGGGVPFLVLGAPSTWGGIVKLTASGTCFSSALVVDLSGTLLSLSDELDSGETFDSLIGIATASFSSASNFTLLTGGKNTRRVVWGLLLSAEKSE